MKRKIKVGDRVKDLSCGGEATVRHVGKFGNAGTAKCVWVDKCGKFEPGWANDDQPLKPGENIWYTERYKLIRPVNKWRGNVQKRTKGKSSKGGR